MKRFLITLLITLAIVSTVHVLFNGFTIGYDTASDSLFIVGIFMFFISIIAMTDATKVFISFGYQVKSLFGKFRKQHRSYLEYYQDKSKGSVGQAGVNGFIISIIYIAVSVYLAYQHLGM